MNRSIIFVFLLLVTLSMVNTIPHKLQKRETNFQPCPNGPFLNVKVQPDPLVAGNSATFDISGTAENTIDDNDSLFIGFVDLSNNPPNVIGEPFTQSFCSADVKCPIDSGTQFNTKPEVQVPNSLPDAYGIGVVIAPQNTSTASDIAGCAIAVVGTPPSSPPNSTQLSALDFLSS